ncbi:MULTISPECIES: DUF6499 domain-containing protein [Hyphomicrobiales]|uniref:transcriptional regulator domain-containing protein n=1 Tax=Hyphomicrobiales TaxID=356 RepID=UPI002553648A|nr:MULTISPECIES: DUF6499 domain-containing protein [Hyphomicrobiales]
MLNIDWRSAAEYGYAKSIPAAGFAWEYLRRDVDYHREFQAIAGLSEPDPDRLEAFVQRLGVAIFRPILKRRPISNLSSGFRVFSRNPRRSSRSRDRHKACSSGHQCSRVRPCRGSAGQR